jgi:hypothetical protein
MRFWIGIWRMMSQTLSTVSFQDSINGSCCSEGLMRNGMYVADINLIGMARN